MAGTAASTTRAGSPTGGVRGPPRLLRSAARPTVPDPRRAQRGRPFTCTAASDWEAMRQVLRPRPDFRALPARLELVSSRGGPSQVFLAWGIRFCQRGKVKVLGIRETRWIYSLANLDPGRTSKQVRVWGAGPLTPGPMNPRPFHQAPSRLFLPRVPSWPWLQLRTCHRRALRCYSSSQAQGHLQNPPNCSDRAPPFPPTSAT